MEEGSSGDGSTSDLESELEQNGEEDQILSFRKMDLSDDEDDDDRLEAEEVRLVFFCGGGRKGGLIFFPFFLSMKPLILGHYAHVHALVGSDWRSYTFDLFWDYYKLPYAMHSQSNHVCPERERESVCVRERERERERVCV